MIIPIGLLYELQAYGGTLASMAQAAMDDESAEAALTDLMEETEVMQMPFELGKSYLIETVTLYYVGRVTEIGFGWIRLEKASWVHWTGRLSTLISRQSFETTNWPQGEGKPRTEYVGNWIVWPATQAVSAGEWTGPLPEKSIQ